MTTPPMAEAAARRPGPPPPGSATGQWFVFKPWVYDVDAAVGCCAPRPRSRRRTRPRPVTGRHVRAMSERIVAQAGSSGAIMPHGPRHAHAASFAEGIPIPRSATTCPVRSDYTFEEGEVGGVADERRP